MERWTGLGVLLEGSAPCRPPLPALALEGQIRQLWSSTEGLMIGNELQGNSRLDSLMRLKLARSLPGNTLPASLPTMCLQPPLSRNTGEDARLQPHAEAHM